MSRELGKANLFITLTMNDNRGDLQAAVQKGCLQELCGLEITPKAQGQTSQSKMAAIWRLVWRSTSG